MKENNIELVKGRVVRVQRGLRTKDFVIVNPNHKSVEPDADDQYVVLARVSKAADGVIDDKFFYIQHDRFVDALTSKRRIHGYRFTLLDRELSPDSERGSQKITEAVMSKVGRGVRKIIDKLTRV